MKSIISIILSLITISVLGQSKITGTISDSLSNESLIGATVFIPEYNIGSSADMDGKFELQVKPGTYNIEVRYITYNDYKVKVSVASGEVKTLQIRMSVGINELSAINIVSTLNKDSQAELIQTQKNSSQVVDGTTAESFKKTPDSKASDVIKRVSGASVQDNKFIVIRGLNDRYNFGLLNGSPLPSSESDRRAFSFDIFPSNMMDNILIYKTATPDLPGEFAGGIININTTDVKDENFQNIQIGQSYNSLTTFGRFSTYNGSKYDIIGIGSDYRMMPSGLPTTEEFSHLNKSQKADLAKLIKNDWSTYNTVAPTNQNIQYTLGRNWKYNKHLSSFGFVLAYNYQLNYNTNTIFRREFEESETEVIKKMELRDSVFTQNVLNSTMLNFKWDINEHNTIRFKNMYSINSEDKTNIRSGVRELDNDPRQWERSTNMWYTQNNLFTQQLSGSHEIKKSKITWNLSQSDVKRDIPNLRRVVYRKYSFLENDTTQDYVAVIQTNGTIPTAAGNMFWSNSNEKIYSGRVDYSYNLDLGIFKNELKTGVWSQYRDKDFTSRNFGFSQYRPTGGTFNSQLLLLGPDSIFATQNLGLLENGKGGFKLEESTSVDDGYQASSNLNSAYIMADSKINKFRINGGVRVESYNQKFHYVEFGSNLPKTIDTTVIDFLPSVNLIYSPNDKYKIRGSYYKTVSRPEFRELAPFSFYNFIQDNIVSGNTKLQRSVINNYDIRIEYYQSNGQMFSISGFYKEFINPTELINRTGTSGAPELYYDNVTKVQNIGAEVEARFKIYKGLSFYTNASIIRSRVDLHNFIGSDSLRPLQGQSPYILNTGLYWNNINNDLSANVSYNVIGPRIYIVGNVQEPSVWENGRNVIDLQVCKKIKNWELKLNFKDIIAQDLVYFQDLNGNRKLDSSDNNWQQINFGQTVTLSAKFNF
jgi:TonB-dependent receptor